MKYKNFEIKPNGFGRYDLFETKTYGEKSKKVGQSYEENLAWAIPFESALRQMLTLLADDNDGTIQGYIDTYSKESNELKKLLV